MGVIGLWIELPKDLLRAVRRRHRLSRNAAWNDTGSSRLYTLPSTPEYCYIAKPPTFVFQIAPGKQQVLSIAVPVMLNGTPMAIVMIHPPELTSVYDDYEYGRSLRSCVLYLLDDKVGDLYPTLLGST